MASSNLTVSLLEIGLVDELRIMVNRLVLGTRSPCSGPQTRG